MLCREDILMATAKHRHLSFTGSFSENNLPFFPICSISAEPSQRGHHTWGPSWKIWRSCPALSPSLQPSSALTTAQFGRPSYSTLRSIRLFICLASRPLPCSRDRNPSAVCSHRTMNLYFSLLLSSVD